MMASTLGTISFSKENQIEQFLTTIKSGKLKTNLNIYLRSPTITHPQPKISKRMIKKIRKALKRREIVKVQFNVSSKRNHDLLLCFAGVRPENFNFYKWKGTTKLNATTSQEVTKALSEMKSNEISVFIDLCAIEMSFFLNFFEEFRISRTYLRLFQINIKDRKEIVNSGLNSMFILQSLSKFERLDFQFEKIIVPESLTQKLAHLSTFLIKLTVDGVNKKLAFYFTINNLSTFKYLTIEKIKKLSIFMPLLMKTSERNVICFSRPRQEMTRCEIKVAASKSDLFYLSFTFSEVKKIVSSEEFGFLLKYE